MPLWYACYKETDWTSIYILHPRCVQSVWTPGVSFENGNAVLCEYLMTSGFLKLVTSKPFLVCVLIDMFCVLNCAQWGSIIYYSINSTCFEIVACNLFSSFNISCVATLSIIWLFTVHFWTFYPCILDFSWVAQVIIQNCWVENHPICMMMSYMSTFFYSPPLGV